MDTRAAVQRLQNPVQCLLRIMLTSTAELRARFWPQHCVHELLHGDSVVRVRSVVRARRQQRAQPAGEASCRGVNRANNSQDRTGYVRRKHRHQKF